MLESIYWNSSVDWKPSPIVALATSVDDSKIAASREDGSLEIWLVSPGSVGWHCQLVIHGDPESRVSSLVWCHSGSKSITCGRLFSSSIDGSISEWDLFHLKQKIVLESIGVSIWQMALPPSNLPPIGSDAHDIANGNSVNKHHAGADDDSNDSESDSDYDEINNPYATEDLCMAVACDDGCVRLYTISDSDEFVYKRRMPRVSARILSVTWKPDATMIYSGSSDGFIRCWDAKLGNEMFRITAGLSGSGSESDLCIWSVLSLRCGSLVSADSAGNVQFWDSKFGTLLQAHSLHKGSVNALAAAPSHNRVFSAGSDGQVILYKLSSEDVGEGNSDSIMKWIYVGYVRAHTHDVRALTIAVPISQEGVLPDRPSKRRRTKRKPIGFSYHKWAHLGVPMLISGGDDSKLFAYAAKEFLKFSPHDICPAPQRMPIYLVLNSIFNKRSLLLVQQPYWLDLLSVCTKRNTMPNTDPSSSSRTNAAVDLLVRYKSRSSRKIICSAISNAGTVFAYSDHSKPHLIELKFEAHNNAPTVHTKRLPRELSCAHSMIFTSDSTCLVIACHDRKIHVVDVSSLKLIHTYTPSCGKKEVELPAREHPITRMLTSCNGRWLAAINCFGDVYVYNMETQRQHWFISRLNGASVTAGGFSPQNSNVLVISTSLNEVYAFDVEAKQLGGCSMRSTFVLPSKYLEFPGEVIGLSFFHASSSPTIIVYSARAMCCIDLGMPLDREDDDVKLVKKLGSNPINGIVKCMMRDQGNAKLAKNFLVYPFRNPVLFVGCLQGNSILGIDRPWMDVVKSFDAPPVHRHVFGT